MSVVVLGSINIDLVVQVPRLPLRGETAIGERFFQAAGGKGANQAVAAAKLGAAVRETPPYNDGASSNFVELVGQVGDDYFGRWLLEKLQEAGVGTEAVRVNPSVSSGVASIVVEAAGDNAIACAAGANACVDREDVVQLERLLQAKERSVVLLELGVPLAAVMEAARVARRYSSWTILDPAPARSDLPKELYESIDIITPNEVEASQLVGFEVDGPTAAADAAQELHQRGVSHVIITLGEQGAYCSLPDEAFLAPAIAVEVVDTVAAGDAFNGGLAAALASGQSVRKAVQWGTVAGALSVQKSGAQSSLPDLQSFQALFDTLKR